VREGLYLVELEFSAGLTLSAGRKHSDRGTAMVVPRVFRPKFWDFPECWFNELEKALR